MAAAFVVVEVNAVVLVELVVEVEVGEEVVVQQDRPKPLQIMQMI